MPKKAPSSSPPQPSSPVLPAVTSLPAPLHVPAKLTLDDDLGGEEHRSFPRALIRVPFALTIGEGADLRFSATLSSHNLSVSGAFLESTFFLPVGTEVRLRFQLDAKEAPVLARAEIVRRDQPDRRSDTGRSGLAVRFVEFFGQTEVTLAKLFLGERVRAFAESYLASNRAVALTSDLDRVIDALAAWELLKVTRTEDVWRGGM
jgi:hypothetical protein